MALTNALTTALTGMRATQSALALTAANVANAETPGYVRKTVVQVSTAAGATGSGVRVAAINRELDQFIQRQMRIESAGASYASTRADFYDRLQSAYGVPGSSSTIEDAYNTFLESVQALATTPESSSARSATISAGQVLAQQLNGMTNAVQAMRGDAELGLSDAVGKANEAMQRIAEINKQLATASPGDATTANLLDQRDVAIDDLAALMDINVVRGDHNQISVFTNSGIQLVGLTASSLEFDAQGSINPASRWSVDPALRTVGTIVLRGPTGTDVDLLADHSIRSGKIAALVEMRDDVLVKTQTQLDEIASAVARSLSDRTVDGSPVAGGFDVDLSNLSAGNSVRISYTDNLSGQQRTVTLLRVDDPAALPLPDSATADPNDKVVGLDFSGGMPSILSQLSAALNSTGLQFSNPGGNTLRILDDGAPNKINIDAASTTYTVTGLTSGTPELPFFVDGAAPFTNAINANGSQALGFAGRITVNAGLVADASRLIVFQTSPLTPSGDATRPNFILDRLNNGTMSFSPASGIGTATAPFNGSVDAFLRQVISQQGSAAAAAANLKQGQDVVYNSLQERFNNASAVNIDEEMANLLQLQNSYAANARVLTTVKEMLDALLKM
jgi:flagellar hook-associated protein 1 FlgK